MAEELLINVTPMECRVALVENGIVQELFVERAARRGLVGKADTLRKRSVTDEKSGII